MKSLLHAGKIDRTTGVVVSGALFENADCKLASRANPVKGLEKIHYTKFSILLLVITLFSSLNLYAQNECQVNCGTLVGGQDALSSWNAVNFFTKNLATTNATHNSDAFASYTPGGVAFSPAAVFRPNSFGVGVDGTEGTESRFLEVNYVAELDKSEKLLIDFGTCDNFTRADVTLARLYGRDVTINGNNSEAGCWRAFDADFNLVGNGTFVGTDDLSNNNPGQFDLVIITTAPFQYLEFTARPYVPYAGKSAYADNSDYVVQKITPSCTDTPDCNDVVGGTESFSSWNPVAITKKLLNEELFNAANNGDFVGDPNNGGLGVPDDIDDEINYDPNTGKTEALRIDLGKPVQFIQFLTSRLYEGEEGYWIAYKKEGCGLTEVERGGFEGTGSPPEDTYKSSKSKGGKLLAAKNGAGNSTATVSSNSDFDVVEFRSGPIQGAKFRKNNNSTSTNSSETASGYFVNEIIVCPECVIDVIECGEQIGGENDLDSWFKVDFLTKSLATDNATHNSDLLSSYTVGGESFAADATYVPNSFGVGVAGPDGDATRNLEINYIGELNKSEKLLIDVGDCNAYTRLEVTLARFYGLEGENNGEAGCWRAFDSDFNLVANGTFEATAAIGGNNPGLFELVIVTGVPFRYVEFTARPYIDSELAYKTNYNDNSDYVIQKITPVCTEILDCNDLIGGTENFGDWNPVSIQKKTLNGTLFNALNSNDFVSNANTGGLGVLDNEDPEINFDCNSGKTEALRIDLGKSFNFIQFTISQLFQGEEGYWIAYKKEDCGLVEVERGGFEGSDPPPGPAKNGIQLAGKAGAGNTTATASSNGDFDVVEFRSGPIQGAKSRRNNNNNTNNYENCSSGYLVNEIIVCPDCPGASEVISYKPGKQKNGTPLPNDRDNPENALGEPEDVDAPPINFVSLGFGGEITLKFPQAFANGDGNDVKVFETSYGNGPDKPCSDYPEEVEVFASQNGTDFVYLGKGCRDSEYDLGPLAWAQYIKLIDVSDKNSNKFPANADGFDVDGVKCLNGAADDDTPADLTACSAQFVKNYVPGTRKDCKPLKGFRSNPNNALGSPNSHDHHNKFVSLGFGDGRELHVNATKGFIDLGFEFVIFDGDGKNDLKVVETSFGNPQFRNYPEQAEVYVSKDCSNWVFLGKTNAANPDVDCKQTLDTEFDFEGKITWARYVKIVDITDPNAKKRKNNCGGTNNHAFNGAADAFDVDAVICVNKKSCEDEEKAAKTTADNSDLSISGEPLAIYPNPSVQKITLDLSQEDEFVAPDTDLLKVQVYNTMGKLVYETEREMDNEFKVEYDLSSLPKGVYILKLKTENINKTVRLIKN